jgi:uncharacterized protein (DUF4213/DUF364 family)
MKILKDLISSLDLNASVRDIRQGVFHTAVLTRNCGLAATLPRDALKQEPPLIGEAGLLLEKSVSGLAQMALSESILEAAIGMATINSLLEINEESCLNLNARDLIAEKGEGKSIAIVGHFPFLPKLRDIAKELWSIEKNPRKDDFSEDKADDLIPKADVVGITGTALTNHTIEDLLRLCNPRAYVVVLGDSAPLSPLLFDYGVNAVSGTKVINNEIALRCVSQGANFRQVKGIRKLTMVKK